MHAPYALSDASQKPCNSTKVASVLYPIHRGTDNEDRAVKFILYSCQKFCIASGSGSSQPDCCFHNSWRNIFAITMTGPINPSGSKPSVSNSAVQSAKKCPFCGDGFHSAFRCIKFLKLKIPERSDAVKRSRLCLNCLVQGHQARFCSKGACHHCNQKHHSLLHPESQQTNAARNTSSVPPQGRPPANNQQQPQAQPQNQNQQTQAHNTQPSTSSLPVLHSQNTAPLSTTNQPCTSQNTVALPTNTLSTQEILLSTAIVCVKDSYGNTRLARALLDSCSQFYP